jgi:oxepin-CoA hydrolase/3-oxo-5,6-dehydrosuberyl-CoA semialdehyde dehydrogenase
MPYGDDVDELCSWIGRSEGGLVSSIYSDKKGFVQKMIMGIAPYHGRLTVGNERVADHSPGPGSVLPSLVHGGPGRAGGGEELGGLRGLSLYMQRTAVQGSKPLLAKLLLD